MAYHLWHTTCGIPPCSGGAPRKRRTGHKRVQSDVQGLEVVSSPPGVELGEIERGCGHPTKRRWHIRPRCGADGASVGFFTRSPVLLSSVVRPLIHVHVHMRDLGEPATDQAGQFAKKLMPRGRHCDGRGSREIAARCVDVQIDHLPHADKSANNNFLKHTAISKRRNGP